MNETIIDQIESLMAEFGEKSLPMIGDVIGRWRHENRTPEPRAHVWSIREFSAVTLECCDVCGMVKNLDQPNKPCRGPAKVGPKSASTLKPLDG